MSTQTIPEWPDRVSALADKVFGVLNGQTTLDGIAAGIAVLHTLIGQMEESLAAQQGPSLPSHLDELRSNLTYSMAVIGSAEALSQMPPAD